MVYSTMYLLRILRHNSVSGDPCKGVSIHSLSIHVWTHRSAVQFSLLNIFEDKSAKLSTTAVLVSKSTITFLRTVYTILNFNLAMYHGTEHSYRCWNGKTDSSRQTKLMAQHSSVKPCDYHKAPPRWLHSKWRLARWLNIGKIRIVYWLHGSEREHDVPFSLRNLKKLWASQSWEHHTKSSWIRPRNCIFWKTNKLEALTLHSFAARLTGVMIHQVQGFPSNATLIQ
jgi:hypothetical protein